MRFVRKKVLQLLLVLLAVTFLSFLMLNLLPGNTAQVLCGLGGGQECVDQKTQELGLDKPLPVRYVTWLGNAVTGDLGTSARNQQPVWEAIKQRMPVTIELLLYSQFIALVVSIPMAIIAAQRSGGIFDRVTTSVAFALLSIPNFILAIVLILIFAVRLKWFPATGYVDFTDNPAENLKDLFLPALTLAVAEMAVYLRLLRTDLIATLQEDYIMMAKAKGLLAAPDPLAPRLPAVDLLARHRHRPELRSAHRRHVHRRGHLRPERPRQVHGRRHHRP